MAGEQHDQSRAGQGPAQDQYDRYGDDCRMPESLEGRGRLDQTKQDGEKERTECYEVVAPASPDKEDENAGQQRQHRHLIDGHLLGRAPSGVLSHTEVVPHCWTG